MKLDQRDLIKLRLPLLAAIIPIAVAALFAWWSNGIAQQSGSMRNIAANRKQQIEQRLLQVRTEEQDLKERTALFLRLEKSGLIGDEKRLDWTEQLRDLQRQLLLPGMSYEFGPQSPLEKLSGGSYAYHSSPLKIQFRLLHEEDLLNFIGRLQQEAKALVRVRSCSLVRETRQGANGNAPSLLNAECEMDWITLRRASSNP